MTQVAPRAVIETKFGEIELELLSDKAPGHVKNFTDLAKKGFYDGTTFHRVIPGFMIQGGDPNTRDPKASRGAPRHGRSRATTSRPSSTTRPHKRGVLSMARAQSPDSAGCQFFIVVKDSNFLDQQYTAFGRVVRGLEVADQVVNAQRDAKDNPLERIEMKVRVIE